MTAGPPPRLRYRESHGEAVFRIVLADAVGGGVFATATAAPPQIVAAVGARDERVLTFQAVKRVATRWVWTGALALLLVSLAAVAACTPSVVRRPDGGEGLLPVGAEAPEVVAETVAGQQVRLSAMRGRPVVVYFYPKDGTPGCTKQACAFRDAWSRFESAGVGVIGVSADSRDSHRAFAKEHALPFPLAADEHGTLAAAYGVGSVLGMYERVSFLVGRDGRIAKAWPDVDPAVHATEVLDAAKALP